MEDLLIESLESLGYPVYLQGSVADGEKSVFTFWNDDTSTQDNYGNEEITILWEYSVNFYSDSPLLVNSILQDAKRVLKSRGFVIDGVGYDVHSDEEGVTGRGINVNYLQRL